MTDSISVQAHHIIPLASFNDLDLETRKEFHQIFGTLQNEI